MHTPAFERYVEKARRPSTLRCTKESNRVNHEAKAPAQEWWRWPLLPFAAVLGGLLGSIVLILFWWFVAKLRGGFNEEGWYFRYGMPMISSALFGSLYTYISCEMAPRSKVVAGTVMVTILGVFGLLGIVFVWVMPDLPMEQAIQATVNTIATMTAAIVTLMDAFSKCWTGAKQ